MKTIKIILPLLALVAVGFLYWPDRPSYIPQKLWGVWQTDHERYAGRYLDISEAIFTIGQGQQQLQVFFIHRVKMDIVGHREHYTLFYREHAKNQEPLQTFTFFFQKTQESDRIQMSNQGDILWHRAAANKPTASVPEVSFP